jgi:hypothetical protein
MIRRAKKIELLKIVYITNLNTFDLNMFLTFKIMDLKCGINKSSYLCDRRHECI